MPVELWGIKMIRTALACCALAVMAGCSTMAIDVDKAARMDASAILDPSMVSAAADRGTVRIARDSGAWSAAKTVLIYFDGRHVANSEAGRVLELHVPAGAHNVGMQVGAADRPIRYQDMNIVAGQVYDFRISSSSSDDWEITQLR